VNRRADESWNTVVSREIRDGWSELAETPTRKANSGWIFFTDALTTYDYRGLTEKEIAVLFADALRKP
jgi:hypothetical protein